MQDAAYRSSGIAGLDHVLQGLRLGDNVVLQVERILDAEPVIEPFVEAALAQQIPVTYFRYAMHMSPLVLDERVTLHVLDPEQGFERFVGTILDVAEEQGEGAFYVFDCLSELAVDWCSDQMLGNFFMIVCPALYRLDTIAYFAMIRNRHMQRTVENITRTAQVILDVYSNQNQLYIQPLKVDERVSPTIFMLHRWEGDTFEPVTNSATLTEIMATLPHSWLEFSLHRPGVWRRTVMHAQETLEGVKSGKITERECDYLCRRLVRMAFTRDDRYITLVMRYFTLEDLMKVLTRMIGSGLIGGKALGMLLARAVLRRTDPRWEQRLEVHDSFFIGSDVFYTYLVQNGCWWSRRNHAKPDYDAALSEGRSCLLKGDFPQYLVNQFKEMLNYFGQSPIIVRSSSLLEDNFGNAFSGKYDSVFCPNQGPLSTRLEQFMDAVRRIYASTLNPDALVYRRDRGLSEHDEQMALLVQRVSGNVSGSIFFPHVAGVGYSFNPYRWDEAIDSAAGMLRIVTGLGTRAVDRIEDDYARLIALNVPHKRLEASPEDVRQFSQRFLDVLDLDANALRSVAFRDVVKEANELPLEMIASRDEELIERARRHGTPDVFPWVLTFEGLIDETDFVPRVRAMLKAIEQAYENPVDVEFTVNFLGDKRYRINLLQCRPFQVRNTGGPRIPVPDHDCEPKEVLLRSAGPVIGQSRGLHLDTIIYVVPGAYAKLPNSRRFALARLIGKLTQSDALQDGCNLLIGPGRWGTTTPAFGVPVNFQEIRRVTAICEVAAMHEGLVPDISLGTHFFNDLVELDMLYLAIFPDKDGHTLSHERLSNLPNRLLDHLPGAKEWTEAVRVIEARDLPDQRLCLYADSVQQRVVGFVD